MVNKTKYTQMKKDSIKTRIYHIAFLLILPLFIFLVGCSRDDDDGGPSGDANSSILQVMHSIGELSTFTSAVSDYDDITTSLDSDDEVHTVFAPTDQAFSVFMEALGYNSLDDVPADTLRDIIRYHIVRGTEYAHSDLSEDQSLQTLLTNETINISVNGNTVMINTARISEADVEAANGVIHVIDAVLVPLSLGGNPGAGSTIIGVLQINEQLSLFSDAFGEDSELSASLNGSGAYTFFAPTNAAIGAFLEVMGFSSLNDMPDEMLREILQYHVVPQTALAGDDFTDGGELTTLTEEPVTTYTTGSNIIVNSSQVVDADVHASNGVVHIVDAVLVPSGIVENHTTLYDRIVENEELSMFVQHISGQPMIMSVLDAITGNFTVFAPTNNGFQTLLNITNQSAVEDVPDDQMRRFLQYHIVMESISAAGLADRQTLNTLARNEAITISPDHETGSGYLIDKSSIIQADVQGPNGTLHTITGFLFPFTEARVVNTVLEIAYFNKDFSTLIAAAEKAGLFETLIKKDMHYTFFAVDNAGFANAGINPENESEETLAAILNNHMNLQSSYTETQLVSNGSISTQGGELNFSTNGEGTLINGTSQIVRADVISDNGITHIIDKLLIP